MTSSPFGDMPNDVPMLVWAGHGVAMGNAHPEAMAAADEVTAPNTDDGSGRACSNAGGFSSSTRARVAIGFDPLAAARAARRRAAAAAALRARRR